MAEEVKYADHGYTESDIKAISKCNFLFHPHIPVSKKSKFGDSSWDYTDEENVRLKVHSPSALIFNWDEVTIGTRSCRQALTSKTQQFLAILPKEMIEDIKRGLFIYAMFPALLAAPGRAISRKGNSIISMARTAVNLFGFIYLQGRLTDDYQRIRKLSDITFNDVKKALRDYPYRLDEARTALNLFGNHFVCINMQYGEIQWTLLDLKYDITWPAANTESHIETLPNDLFKLLSNKSCEIVSAFLSAMGLPQKDAKSDDTSRDILLLKWPRFAEMFESFVQRRTTVRERGSIYASNHTGKFVKEFKCYPAELKSVLYDVQCAAQSLILLYTGMRYSEAATIQSGCLTNRSGIWLIKSTLIKNQPTNQPVDDDEWVAIDIVQDAVRALEELSRCTLNRFLFANFESVKKLPDGVRGNEHPLTNSGLDDRLNGYLDRIDADANWSGWRLSPHQFRHGLIYQLARAEVGIPYITRQLKHKHGLLAERSYKIKSESMVYGMQKERLIGNATGITAMQAANLEIVQDMFGEGRKFAGGGAAHHIARTDAFFKGQGLEGERRENFLRKLAQSGVAWIRTGVGFCLRNHVDPKKIKENPPPCIGDLKCNPKTCQHSVVPEGQKPNIIRLYIDAIKNLEDPTQAYLKEHWKEQRESIESMLIQLGINPEEVRQEVI